MPRRAAGQPADRVQAYLSSEQVSEINRVRGRYLTETGNDIRVTQVLRAAVDHLVKLNWADLRRILEAQTVRRSRGDR